MRIIYIFITFLIISCNNISGQRKDTSDFKIPFPKVTSLSSTDYVISKKAKIIDDELELEISAVKNSIINTIKYFGKDIFDTTQIKCKKLDNLEKINPQIKNLLVDQDAYLLLFNPNKVLVYSLSNSGLLIGLSTLEYLIEYYNGSIPFEYIVDYPDIKNRVLHISQWPCRKEDFKDVIRVARLNHFNKLIWLNHFGVKINSLSHISGKNAWSVSEFKEMISFVHENGFEIIPELKLLTHQEKFLSNKYPQYLYNSATYDPNKKDVYTLVFEAIDELIELTGATKFHIGHDEVLGWNPKHLLKYPDLEQLPSELYLKDVNIINDYLQEHNIEVWMWGDMLIDPIKYPELKNSAGVHGQNDYFKIGTRIPKNIVICDWHYFGRQRKFPSSFSFMMDGYEVYGATWNNIKTTKSFSKYLTRLPLKPEGMIATTWYGINDRKEEIISIIEFSGDFFWNVNDN